MREEDGTGKEDWQADRRRLVVLREIVGEGMGDMILNIK